MTEPVTTNKQFTIPNTGDLPNAWGPPLNGNFTALDNLLGSSASLVVSSGTYTLTSAQAQNLRIALTGTLTGNVTINIPQYAGFYYFHDLTTRGGYTITVTTTASGQRTQNLPFKLGHVFTDGANVWLVSEPLHGETKPFSGWTIPPLWQAAIGQAVSRTTYSDLFGNITFQTTGNISSGSGSITNVPALPIGLSGNPPYAVPIEGLGLAVGTVATNFSGSAGNYTITISPNATATNSGTPIRLLPNGQGDGSTTFNLPDCRGRAVFGQDSGAGRLTNTSMGTASRWGRRAAINP